MLIFQSVPFFLWMCFWWSPRNHHLAFPTMVSIIDATRLDEETEVCWMSTAAVCLREVDVAMSLLRIIETYTMSLLRVLVGVQPREVKAWENENLRFEIYPSLKQKKPIRPWKWDGWTISFPFLFGAFRPVFRGKLTCCLLAKNWWLRGVVQNGKVKLNQIHT